MLLYLFIYKLLGLELKVDTSKVRILNAFDEGRVKTGWKDFKISSNFKFKICLVHYTEAQKFRMNILHLK